MSTASLKTVTLLGEIFYSVYIKNFIHQFIHSPQKNVRAEVGPVREGRGGGGGREERGGLLLRKIQPFFLLRISPSNIRKCS